MRNINTQLHISNGSLKWKKCLDTFTKKLNWVTKKSILDINCSYISIFNDI
jgi:hypothetical protein